jgi:hypothetical protein
MRLQINETLFQAGQINMALGESELRAAEVGVAIQRDLVLGALGPADEIQHNLPDNSADFLSADPLADLRKTGLNDQGEYEGIFTADQVFDLAAATLVAAKMKHNLKFRPDSGVADPTLGTILAIMSAESKEAANNVIREHEAHQRYNPLADESAPNTPGRRALLGFAAAEAVLWHTTNYPQALITVSTFNHSQLAA